MTALTFSAPEEPYSLLGEASSRLKSGEKVAMITLINVEGGSPYPVGTQMLVFESGAYLGQITGGCAERAIADHAVEALRKGKNRCIRYGAGSQYFDIQLPCGSGVDVLIDVESTFSDYQKIVSVVRSRKVARQELVADSNQTFSKLHIPSPRLILLGQGDILAQSCNLAIAAGFEVAAIVNDEHTKSLVERFEIKSNEFQTRPEMSSVCDEFTGIVSLFHEHDLELDVLAESLSSSSFYIGALGSRKTHSARIEHLRKKGLDEDCMARIHGPVGVNINSASPRQIAVSIIAEAVDKLNSQIDALEQD